MSKLQTYVYQNDGAAENRRILETGPRRVAVLNQVGPNWESAGLWRMLPRTADGRRARVYS